MLVVINKMFEPLKYKTINRKNKRGCYCFGAKKEKVILKENWAGLICTGLYLLEMIYYSKK